MATTLGKFRHKNTEQLLISLLSHKDPNVRDSGAESIMKIKGKEGLKILERFSNDPVIKNVIEDYNS